MGFERRKAAELTEMAFAGKLWATRVGNDNEGRRVPTEEEWICQWCGGISGGAHLMNGPRSRGLSWQTGSGQRWNSQLERLLTRIQPGFKTG